MRGGLACTVFCCSVDRWMYEVENVARRGVRRERARVRARETRVSVHCGVALVPVWCERPDRVSTRHGDRVSCVRCATGRTARGVVCSWSLESAPPLVVWVAWCGACGAQMAVWVSTELYSKCSNLSKIASLYLLYRCILAITRATRSRLTDTSTF